jgi:uncharacterized protein (DUF427 family)
MTAAGAWSGKCGGIGGRREPFSPNVSTIARENVDDYPTPPSYEPSASHVRVEVGGITVADTHNAIVARQTGIAPVYYFPAADVDTSLLVETEDTSNCPYKGDAFYYALELGHRRIANAVWSYPETTPEAEPIKGRFAFYAHLVTGTVDGVRAEPPEWTWVGGWLTPGIEGSLRTGTR